MSFEGRSILGLPIYRRARLGLARTFQRMELFSGMTVRDHLLSSTRRACHGGQSFLRDLIGRSQPSDRGARACDGVLDLLGLTPDADRPDRGAEPRPRTAGRAGSRPHRRAPSALPRRAVVGPRPPGDPRHGHGAQQPSRGTPTWRSCWSSTTWPWCRGSPPGSSCSTPACSSPSGPSGEVFDDPAVRSAYLGSGL